MSLAEALRQADQTKVNRLLNIRQGLEADNKSIKPIITVQRNVPDRSSRCLTPLANPYKQKKESPRELNAAFVKQLREKQRNKQEQVHEEDDIKKLEEWVRLETKKTISALEKYIKVSSQEKSDSTLFREEEPRQVIQSDENEVLSSSTSPLSQVYLGRSMRGKALRAFPRKKMLETARKINIPGRRSSLIERSLPDTCSTDWRQVTGTAMIQSPHLHSIQGQQSQEFPSLESQASHHPLVYLQEGDPEEAKLFPRQRSTFQKSRRPIKDTLNLSLTLPQWRGGNGEDTGEQSREKTLSVQDRSPRYH